MTLANVGTNQGVNTIQINEVLLLAKDHNIFAAGGVRNMDDLIKLKDMGVHGALIATALHQKQFTYQQLDSLCK
jgi:phosphoribosylformimino-5-aminoimidazole carboxamide ribotide isomerase